MNSVFLESVSLPTANGRINPTKSRERGRGRMLIYDELASQSGGIAIVTVASLCESVKSSYTGKVFVLFTNLTHLILSVVLKSSSFVSCIQH